MTAPDRPLRRMSGDETTAPELGHWTFFDIDVPDPIAWRMADRMVLRERDGGLIYRCRTELRLSVPPADIPRPRKATT